MKRSSVRTPAAVAAIAALMIAPLAPPAASGATCKGVERDGPWAIADGPDFPAGGASITDHVVARRTMAVTNGTSVMVSKDSGCAWAASFSLPDAASSEYPYTADTATIVALEMLDHGRAAPVVAAVIREDVGGAGRPHIAIGRLSSARGEWSSGDSGLPVAGEPEFLADAPSDGSTAYIGIDVGGGSIDLLYATTDGGASWALRSDIAALRPQAGVTTLEVDPLTADDLWAGGSGGLFHSVDGGRSFEADPRFAGEPVGPVDAFHDAGQAARLLVHLAAANNFAVSADGGASWFIYPSASGEATSIAHGATATDVVVTAAGRVWLMHVPTQGWFDMEAPVLDVADVVASPDSPVSYHGRTPTTIVSYTGSFSEITIDVDDDGITNDVDIIRDPSDDTVEASLRQNNDRVVVPLNGEKTVPYHLTVPRHRVPIDLVFLLDTSSSMTRFTAGLADAYADIANGLVDAGLDVNFGIAEHRAYPDFFPPRTQEPNFVYKNRLQIGASGAEMAAVLESLETEGGGIYDAQLGALYQLASGAGQDVFPPGPSDRDVPPNQEMGFRAGAPLRIVILGTDEPFGGAGPERDPDEGISPNPPPDIPSFDEVISALNGQRVKQIGLAVGPESKPTAEDLATVAKGTDALAPMGGVDCDGDGEADLPRGEPLVCTMSRLELADARNLVPAIVNLVEAVRAHTAVGLQPSAGDQVVERISPDRYSAVVLQNSRDLRFDVTFKCNLTQAGKQFTVRFDATEKNRVLDSIGTRVICSERPDFTFPPVLAPLIAVVAPPPAAPPPGIPEIASQVNSQAQFHGAAAAAHQEQQQPQLALVHSIYAEQEQAAEEYAMTSYRRSSEPELPGLPLGGAALLMGFAYEVAVRTRDRVQLARARR